MLMKSVNIPRPLILLIMIIVAFLIGALRDFGSVHAAPSTAAKVAGNGNADVSTTFIPTPLPTYTEETDLPPKSTPMPIQASADTTGIIALAIVIVTTILVGAAWGVRRSPKNITPKNTP